MFQSIRQKLLALSGPNPHRKARRRPSLRRLNFESLEGRTLLSAASVATISDGSFEVPALAANSFAYAPNGSAWQFSGGGSGVATNGSAFTFDNPNAPDGNQVAFLQGTGGMSQSLHLDAGTYNLSFQAAQRADPSQQHYQEVQVLVDGAQVALVTPGGSNYGLYDTQNFTVGTGTHTIQFVGLNPAGGDNTALIDEVAITAQADSITDGSFEAPGLAANAFQYAPDGSAWQFSAAGAGVTSNDSAFNFDNPNAPDGSQVAFLQGAGSMSQSLYLDAGTYNLSFLAAQRAAYQQHYQEFQVLVDGAQVGLINPASTDYYAYQTQNFTVGSGMHTIQFVGLNPAGGDNTAFVDDLALTAQTDTITDGSFETPSLVANSYQYAPTGSAWQFSAAGAGLAFNGSGFTANNPNSPDPNGSQVAFLQGTGSMSESVYLDAGTYNLSFLAAQRAGPYQQSYQELQILVDGAQVGLVNPGSTDYASFQTQNFTVGSGTHTIQFVGLNPAGGDNTAFVDELAITAQADSITGGSFETPTLVANSFQYAPTGSSWQFSPGAGVTTNGSAFTADNPNAPNGNQVAFLQCGGSMSEPVYLDAGTYSLTFMAAQRAGSSQQHYQEFEVLVDGAQVGLVTPSSTDYGAYQTQNFTVAAGTHTIRLLGLNPAGGDNTAFVDQLAIATQTDLVTDGSFEVPGLPANTFQYAPNGSTWQFSGEAGVATNGSAFTADNPNSPDPDGNQVAFVQGNGSISQSLYLDAGTYSLSFQAAQRAGSSQQHYQELNILVDGNQISQVTPASTNYGLYQTPTFTVTAGMHTIQFVGLNPAGGDNTAFVDLVQI